MRDVLVLAYHAVDASFPDAVAVTPEQLRRQVLALLRRGYVPVTFSETARESRGVCKRFCVTFDDGFASVHQQALPVLASLGVPATAFVTTAFVSSGAPLHWDGYDRFAVAPPPGAMSPMSWDMVRDLTDHGWEIGSHTRTHPHLPWLDDTLLDEELRGSRAEIEAVLGRRCATLAYPYGELDRRVERAARAAGYDAAGALGYRVRGRVTAVPRVAVYRGDGMTRFKAKVSRPARSTVGAGLIAVSHEVLGRLASSGDTRAAVAAAE